MACHLAVFSLAAAQPGSRLYWVGGWASLIETEALGSCHLSQEFSNIQSSSDCDIMTMMQVTSVLGDTVTDTIQSTSGGTGTAQFPAHAVSPVRAMPPRKLHPAPLQPEAGA